ncbi:unnamed protein product [Adineta ricciae]|uniref:OTU domain-containing protein n=1 Tax=Adineta ricciae TaxID=249248 RepID=A0A815NZS3_ADIRI|nr:unnamed protein product [Adineta ricciae]CAF1440827.1 unnamed protein product [Adineta ricciae]
MSRGQKFGRLLRLLERCSERVAYYEEIGSAVHRIRRIESIMTPLEFRPYGVFDDRIHVVDLVAKQYLEKAATDVQHLIPVDVDGDGNCLYHSILLLMNNSTLTTSELRVRTIIELVTNQDFYGNAYTYVVQPIDIAIKAICRNRTYSELYEICALCSILKCNIRSVYPEIDFRDDMAVMNSIFQPIPPIVANYQVAILWCNLWKEMDVRAVNNSTWSPNHFVSLLLPSLQSGSSSSNHRISLAKTPEKKTVKNNVVAQIRLSDFESSPSRRLRSDSRMSGDQIQLINLDAIEQHSKDDEPKRQMRLSILRERARSRRNSETDQQRQDRLVKVKERARSRRASEVEGQRQNRLDQNKERVRSIRMNETLNESESRLEENRRRVESIRMNETETERESRLEQNRQCVESIRMNETDEEHQIRINHQRIRSQANRTNKRLDKETSDITDIQGHSIHAHSSRNRNNFRNVGGSTNDFFLNETMTSIQKNQTSSAWPAPIPTALKEACLQQFLQRMSMSALAEVTCAICNIRTPEQQSKKIATSEIPHLHLLKVSD